MIKLLTAPLALLLTGALLALPQDPGLGKPVVQDGPALVSAKEVVAAQRPSYPLTKCVVSGEKLGEMGEPIDHVVDGRLVRLCCKGCVKKVDADPKAFIAKIDEAVIAAQKPIWPLDKCPVSGEAYGGDMEPVDFVHGTRYVKLCCKGCVRGFDKNPQAVLDKVDAALIAQQKKDYPLKTCVVSGETLGEMGEPIDYLSGTTLVRLCCKGCVKKVRETPEPFVAKVAAARAQAPKNK